MDDQRKARPVSGEIMTATEPRASNAGGEPRRGDFTDAEYEAVPSSPEQTGAPLIHPSPTPAGLSLLAGAAAAASAGPSRGGPVFWSFSVLVVVLAFWISGGHALIRDVMPTAITTSAQPLRIADVQSRVERHNGRDVLFVTGRAENRGGQTLPLPPIEIAVTSSDNRLTRYNLGTRDTELKPGERYSFSSRLEAPTNGVRTVSVTFLEAVR